MGVHMNKKIYISKIFSTVFALGTVTLINPQFYEWTQNFLVSIFHIEMLWRLHLTTLLLMACWVLNMFFAMLHHESFFVTKRTSVALACLLTVFLCGVFVYADQIDFWIQ